MPSSYFDVSNIRKTLLRHSKGLYYQLLRLLELEIMRQSQRILVIPN